MTTTTDAGPEVLFARVQELQEQLDAQPPGATRELAGELVSAIVRMYGSGLERIVAGLHDTGEGAGAEIAQRLGEDPIVATLLLIHDLHPVALEDRVQQALESVRPYMESHGGNVELLSVEDGVARIHLRGSCSDCSASSVTLELAIKRALEEAAPDLAGLEVEGVAPQMPGLALPMSESAVGAELPVVMSGPGTSDPRDDAANRAQASPPPPAVEPAAPAWVELDASCEPDPGKLATLTVGGGELIIANVEGTLLAYRDRCAACGEALHGGELSAGALACPHCQRAFFLPRAGRSLDGEQLQLEPVPLLRELGRVKVAVAGP